MRGVTATRGRLQGQRREGGNKTALDWGGRGRFVLCRVVVWNAGSQLVRRPKRAGSVPGRAAVQGQAWIVWVAEAPFGRGVKPEPVDLSSIGATARRVSLFGRLKPRLCCCKGTPWPRVDDPSGFNICKSTSFQYLQIVLSCRCFSIFANLRIVV